MFDMINTTQPKEDSNAEWERTIAHTIREAVFVERSPLLALAVWLVRKRSLDIASKIQSDHKKHDRSRYMYPLE